MGIRNQDREVLSRLEAKTLDAQFMAEIQEGLNCSPFEAEAVVSVVHEVYAPYLDSAPAEAPPGKISLVAVSVEEPAGKPLAKCQKQTVTLTVHRGTEDDRILKREGPADFIAKHLRKYEADLLWRVRYGPGKGDWFYVFVLMELQSQTSADEEPSGEAVRDSATAEPSRVSPDNDS